MADQDAAEGLPLPQTDEGAAAPAPAVSTGEGGAGQDPAGFVEGITDPEAGSPAPGTEQEGMGQLLGVQQRRAEADARAAGRGLEDIAFDSQGVQRVITRLRNLHDKLQNHRYHADPIAQIEKRADYASRLYALTANSGGESYLDALDKEIDDLKDLIEHAEEMKKEREQFEEDTADQLGRQS